MKIACLSDSHGWHKNVKLPKVDIVLFCGDYAKIHSFLELPDFGKWLDSIPAKHKVMVGGNHDWALDKNKAMALQLLKENCPDIIYLENSGIEIEGIKIYGTPVQPIFGNWAFMKKEKSRRHYYSMIPNDLDILMTHCPPHNILDKCLSGDNVGCEILAKEIELKKPKYHIFGHIHEVAGSVEQGDTTYINCSLCDPYNNLKNKPIVLEVEND